MLTSKVAVFLLMGCLHISKTAAVMATNKTVQALPESCKAADCSSASLPDLQTMCCSNDSAGLMVHCQEQQGSSQVVIACLANATCGKGTYAKIFQGLNEENKTVAWAECLRCASTTYQPSPLATTAFRYDRCTEAKTVCNGIVLFHGGATRNDKCGCDTPNGYIALTDNNTDCEISRVVTQHCSRLECSSKECDKSGCIILIATVVSSALFIGGVAFSWVRRRCRGKRESEADT